MALKVKVKNPDKKSKVVNFLKTGKKAKAAFKREKIKDKKREEERGKLWRFFINKDDNDTTHKITFLDGDLDEDGQLSNPVYYEHNIQHNGKYIQFASCGDQEPDPLQEMGQEPTLSQVFTIINHTKYETNDGKIYRDRKMLLVATKATIAKLEKIARKRGGLTGCTFEITRSNERAPRVGDTWEFAKKRSRKELRKFLLEKKNPVSPKEIDELMTVADYQKEITYYTAKELIKLGYCEQRKTLSTKSAKYDDLDDDL